jgi:hypothetical protein
LLLRIRRSKTDPEAAGQEIGIPPGSHQETDPVIALQRWRRLAEIDSGPCSGSWIAGTISSPIA